MVKCVFFDFDGVLTLDRSGNQVTANYVSAKLGLTPEYVKKVWKEAYGSLDDGNGDVADAWGRFCKNLGVDFDISVLYDSYSSLRMNKPVLDLIASLRKMYKVGLISDNGRERFEFLDEKLHISERFDYVTISCYVHSTKHGERIFEEALRKAGTTAGESVFIDNNAGYIDVAKNAGLRTILYDSSDNDFEYLLNKLKEYGVIIA